MSFRLTFLTVLPAPYQRETFAALDDDDRFALRVFYYTRSASDRDWAERPLGSFEKVLPGTTLSWLGKSAHINPGIISLLKRDTADLVVVSDYSAPTAQLAMRYLNHVGRPWVFWGEIPGFRNRSWFGRSVRRGLQRPLITGATAIAAIGTQAAQVYKELTGSRIPVFNIPYFCDLARYREAAASRRFHRNDSDIKVLFSGQLIRRKGGDVLVAAFVRIADRLPTLRLLLLGDGPERQRLAGMVPPSLAERVEFLGFRQPEGLPQTFADADIFVLPSRQDGWGVVINEALGAGLPIIASERVGAARDLIEPGVNGFIVPSDDVDALADALVRLGTSETLRVSFGQASSARSKTWGLDEAVARWTDLCRTVLGGGTGA